MRMVLLNSLLLALGHFLTFCVWYTWYKTGGVVSADDVKCLADNPDTCLIYPACLYEGFIGGEAYTFWNQIYFYILPIFAALPFGSSYFQDETTGYLKQIYTRVGKMKYLMAKLFVTFCSGALGGAMTYVFSFLLNALYIPAIHPSEVALHSFVTDVVFMSQWYFSKPWLYFGIYLILIMMCGGVLAICSLLVSFVAKNSLIIIVFPFILYMSVDYMLMELGLTKYSISGIINPMSGDSKYNLNIQNVIWVWLAILIICSISFLWTGYHRKKIV